MKFLRAPGQAIQSIVANLAILEKESVLHVGPEHFGDEKDVAPERHRSPHLAFKVNGALEDERSRDREAGDLVSSRAANLSVFLPEAVPHSSTSATCLEVGMLITNSLFPERCGGFGAICATTQSP